MPIRSINEEEFKTRLREKYGVADPREKACFKKPPEYFEKKLGLKFQDLRDDLDDLKAASFILDDEIEFILYRYKRTPAIPNLTVLQFANSITGHEGLKTIERIADAFDLRQDEIELL